MRKYYRPQPLIHNCLAGLLLLPHFEYLTVKEKAGERKLSTVVLLWQADYVFETHRALHILFKTDADARDVVEIVRNMKVITHAFFYSTKSIRYLLHNLF